MIYLASVEGDTLVTYPYEGFFAFNDLDYFLHLASVLGATKLYHNGRMEREDILPTGKSIKVKGLLEVSPYMWIGGSIKEDPRLNVGFVNNTPIFENLVEAPNGLLIPAGVSDWYDDTGIVQFTNHPASMSKDGDIYATVPTKADLFLVGDNKYVMGRYKGIASIAPLITSINDAGILELMQSLGEDRVVMPISYAELLTFPGYVNEDNKSFTMFILDMMDEKEKGVFYSKYAMKGVEDKLGIGYDTRNGKVLTCLA